MTVLGAGDVDGMDGELLGELLGDPEVGAAIRASMAKHARRGLAARGGGGAQLALPPKPPWRKEQAAPGVPTPGYGKQSLGLQPQTNNGVFNAANPNIIFQVQTQQPFHAVRILCNVNRTSTGGNVNQVAPLALAYVGSKPQQPALVRWNIEQIGATFVLGADIDWTPADPGIIIAIDILSVPTITAADTMFINITLQGGTVT